MGDESYGVKEMVDMLRTEMRSGFEVVNAKVDAISNEVGRQGREIERVKGALMAYGTICGIIGAIGAALILKGLGA